jgi:hypothetical protein
MKNEPHFLFNISRARRNVDPTNYPDVKPWVVTAISEESQNADKQLWRDEPTAEYSYVERLRRIRLCRKYEKQYPELKDVADRLELCEPTNRCYSGACPECGRLFQRSYVRQTKRAIANIIAHDGNELIAICIVPSWPLVRHGQLKHFSISNFQRRIKNALDTAGVQHGIGGIDFSFNEDHEQEWQPSICPHLYLITSITDKEALRKCLKSQFPKNAEVSRPIKLPTFENNARRRSYSLKMTFKRRVSYYKVANGKRTRNTSNDKLRANERIELFLYLNQIGLAARVVFRGIKPELSSSKVRFRKT